MRFSSLGLVPDRGKPHIKTCFSYALRNPYNHMSYLFDILKYLGISFCLASLARGMPFINSVQILFVNLSVITSSFVIIFNNIIGRPG